MPNVSGKPRDSLGKEIRKLFLTGILVLAPIGITVWVLIQIFLFVDGILSPVLRLAFGRSLPGVGFVIVIILIFLTGAVAGNIGEKKLIDYFHSLVGRVPIVRPLYSSIKQILDSFSEAGRTVFTQVVLVEFPRKGMRTLGFITGETSDKAGKKLLNVYIPGSPAPTSGFLQIMREEEVIRTTISVNQGMKMVISAGKVTPWELRESWPVENEPESPTH